MVFFILFYVSPKETGELMYTRLMPARSKRRKGDKRGGERDTEKKVPFRFQAVLLALPPLVLCISLLVQVVIQSPKINFY
jgi:hypothetical protein